MFPREQRPVTTDRSCVDGEAPDVERREEYQAEEHVCQADCCRLVSKGFKR